MDLKLEEVAMKEDEELQRKRAAIAEEKERRKKRKESKNFVERFLVKQNVVDKTCRIVDAQKMREFEKRSAQERLAGHKAENKRHADLYGEKFALIRRQTLAQVTHTANQIEYVLRTRRRKEAQNLEEKRRQVQAEKDFKALVKSARDELQRHERGIVSASDVADYERTLQAFRDLSEQVRYNAEQVCATLVHAGAEGLGSAFSQLGETPGAEGSEELFPMQQVVGEIFPLNGGDEGQGTQASASSSEAISKLIGNIFDRHNIPDTPPETPPPETEKLPPAKGAQAVQQEQQPQPPARTRLTPDAPPGPAPAQGYQRPGAPAGVRLPAPIGVGMGKGGGFGPGPGSGSGVLGPSLRERQLLDGPGMAAMRQIRRTGPAVPVPPPHTVR